jgi:transposase
MDVHARSVTVCAIVKDTGETATKTFREEPLAEAIASWIKGFPGPYYAAYESGCTGFHLCRALRRLSIDCDVIAVSSIPRPVAERKKKTDRIDAARLAKEILKPRNDLSVVWLPDEECEGARDLERAYTDAIDAMKRAKQQLLAFLLRHGYIYYEKTSTGHRKKTFTKDFFKWLASISFADRPTELAFQLHSRSAQDAIEMAKDAKAVLEAFIFDSRFTPYVEAISCLKGVAGISAFVYAAEIGGFSRFKSGRKLPSWAGIIPSLYASGDKSYNGHITKAGNTQVRRYLTEGLNGLVYLGRPEAKAQKRSSRVSDACRGQAKKGSRRLVEKIEHLKQRGKQTNIIKTAVASELIRWVWVIGGMVESEQAKAQSQTGLDSAG